MKKPEIVIEHHPAGHFLSVTCPDCGATNRYPFERLTPDSTIDCTCGVGFNLSSENYDRLQQKIAEDEGLNGEPS